MAIGAQGRTVAGHLTGEVLCMVFAGTFVGLALGIASARYIRALLYQVTPTDLSMLALPALVILTATFLAGLPVVTRAIRIDPARSLRDE
jgi:putative ABC transport system permease protein